MGARRTKGEDLPAGISRRHSRTCPAARTDDLEACRCRPTYQAQAGPRSARQTKTWPTLAAAKSWKRDIDRAQERGELTGGRAPRLRDAAALWLTDAADGIALGRGDKRYKPSTLRGYRRCMEAELYPKLGDMRLDKITRGMLNEFVKGLMRRGLAAQTVKNIVVPLRALYRHAIDLEQVSANPTIGVRVPAGSGRRLRFLVPAEIRPLLDTLDDRDRALWATAIYAGLRRGELMALRWADVNLAAGVITVRLSYDPGSKEMGEVKSEAGQDRKVPITGALRDYLLEHRQRAGGRPRGLVFSRGSLAIARRGNNGEPDAPFADQGVGQRARRHWDAAGVGRVTLHDCRHTFASLMIAAMADAGSFNPKTIQSMLGHASIQQTYDRYGHLFPGAEEEAGRMLDAFLDVASMEKSAYSEALPKVAQPEGEEVTREREGPALPSVTHAAGAGCDDPTGIQRSEIRRVR